MSLCRWSACRPITHMGTSGRVSTQGSTKGIGIGLASMRVCVRDWLVVPLHYMTLHYIAHTYRCKMGVCMYVCVYICAHHGHRYTPAVRAPQHGQKG